MRDESFLSPRLGLGFIFLWLKSKNRLRTAPNPNAVFEENAIFIIARQVNAG
jgi:hypothetical protein